MSDTSQIWALFAWSLSKNLIFFLSIKMPISKSPSEYSHGMCWSYGGGYVKNLMKGADRFFHSTEKNCPEKLGSPAYHK